MLDESKKRELEEKHRRVEVVETLKGTAVFKPLDRRQRNEYLSKVAQNQIGQAADFACLATVLIPTRQEFDAWLDEEPGIAMQCMSKLAGFNRLAGVDEGKE